MTTLRVTALERLCSDQVRGNQEIVATLVETETELDQAMERNRMLERDLGIDMHLPPRPLRRIVEYSPPHPLTSRPERTEDDHPNWSEQCANIGRLRLLKVPSVQFGGFVADNFSCFQQFKEE
ncbi:MAG TPA: hypothetical protein VGC10_09870 [Sphingomonas sp.]